MAKKGKEPKGLRRWRLEQKRKKMGKSKPRKKSGKKKRTGKPRKKATKKRTTVVIVRGRSKHKKYRPRKKKMSGPKKRRNKKRTGRGICGPKTGGPFTNARKKLGHW